MSDNQYLFDNASPEAAGRFAGLETALDPTTFRHLSDLGVGPGWTCLEIGAGGGSVVRWLAYRIKPTGRVLGTDLNLDRVDVGDAPNVELRVHDVVRDPLDGGLYDLIHARLVLVHIPERDAVIGKLVAALRPGGWLLLEEFARVLPYVPVPATEAEQLLNRVLDGIADLLPARGVDNVAYPQTLVRRLRAHGLSEAGGEGTMIFGQRGVIDVHRANLRQVREQLVATGRVSAEDIAAALQTLEDPNLVAVLPMLVSAWGRKA